MKNSDLKKQLKKSLLMLGLASSLTLGATEKNYASTNFTIESMQDKLKEKMDEIQKTENYYLIRIEGNNYLCKKMVIGDNDNQVIKFFDIKDNKFVGQILKPDKQSRRIHLSHEYKKEHRKQEIILEDYTNDYNYFDGKYGYQNNLP